MNYPFLFVSAVLLGFCFFYMRNEKPETSDLEVMKECLKIQRHNQWLGFGFLCLSIVMLLASAHFKG